MWIDVIFTAGMLAALAKAELRAITAATDEALGTESRSFRCRRYPSTHGQNLES
jgi:hypothetical protein